MRMIERFAGYIQELRCLTGARILMMLFLLTFPFQIRSLIFQMPFFPTGNFNEYASFFVYLSDLLLMGALALYGAAIARGESKNPVHYGYAPFTLALLFFLAALLGTVFFAEVKILTFFQVFRFFELFALYFLLVNDLLTRREVLRFFLYGMLAQSVIAMWQYLQQSSVGLRFLGEPVVSNTMQGVAKIDLDGAKVLRSYGTFSHPNVLGGAIVVALLWAYYLFRKNLWVLLAVGAVLLMGLLLTFSRTAFLALGGGLLVYFSLSEKRIRIRHILLWGSIGLFLVVLFHLEGVLFERIFQGDPQSAVERVQYMTASKGMLMEHPLGVGLGHFTLYMQEYVPDKFSPWLLQPVHNVYLLLVNEAGAVSGALFVVLLLLLFSRILRVSRHSKEDDRLFLDLSLTILAIIGVVSLFDHYFVTLYPAQVLLFLYFGLVSSSLKSSLLPRKNS